MRKFFEDIFENEALTLYYKEYNFSLIKSEYNTTYLLFFLKEEEELLDLQSQYADIFNSIKGNKEIYRTDMDKNIICIFFLCVEDEDYYAAIRGEGNNLNKEICMIEEDLNYFKKHVFVYTKTMEDAVKMGDGSFEELCRVYLTNDNFQAYKKSYNDNPVYDFIINLFVKLPFLNFRKYDKNASKDYIKISDFIENECKTTNVNKFDINYKIDELKKVIDSDEKLYEWLDRIAINKDILSEE